MAVKWNNLRLNPPKISGKNHMRCACKQKSHKQLSKFVNNFVKICKLFVEICQHKVFFISRQSRRPQVYSGLIWTCHGLVRSSMWSGLHPPFITAKVLALSWLWWMEIHLLEAVFFIFTENSQRSPQVITVTLTHGSLWLIKYNIYKILWSNTHKSDSIVQEGVKAIQYQYIYIDFQVDSEFTGQSFLSSKFQLLMIYVPESFKPSLQNKILSFQVWRMYCSYLTKFHKFSHLYTNEDWRKGYADTILPWEPCQKVLIAFQTFLQDFDSLIVGNQQEIRIPRQRVLIPKINHIRINFTTIFKFFISLTFTLEPVWVLQTLGCFSPRISFSCELVYLFLNPSFLCVLKSLWFTNS